MSFNDQKKPPPHTAMEILEVEDEDARHRRLEAFMHKLDSNSRPAMASNHSFPPAFDFGDRKTYAMDPPSELLARVQSFLPQIEASNVVLSQAYESDPKSVDIENVAEDAEHYIEMNLGLGVFEQRNDEHRDFEMGASSSSSSESDEDISDTDTDDSSEIITSHSASPRVIKPLPKRTWSGKSPQIVVLGDGAPGSL